MKLKNNRILPVANLLLTILCVLAIVSCATGNAVFAGMQVDFEEKYNVSENDTDISVPLQKAIDDLPKGGVWNMNGALGTDGKPKNLPNAETVGALGFGYGSDITLRNITFIDGYNSHFIQICAMGNVLIENCRFEGQAFMGEGNRTRELIQIEPGSIKGYPYTLAQDVQPTKNVTIRDCYFGASEKSPEYMVAIGTHGQQNSVKCSDINIENCVFDNAAWCAIRFWAYDRVSIKDNKFIMTDVSNQKNRYAILADSHPYGAVIDTGGAHNTTNLVIANNIFEINAKDVTAIGVTGNGGSPKKPKDITITQNTFTGSDSDLCIELYRVENCSISNNQIHGFVKNIVAKLSAQEVTSDEYVEFAE